MSEETNTVNYPDLPHMWVDKILGIDRRNNFIYGIRDLSQISKLDLLSSFLPPDNPETQCIKYPLNSFQTLINKMDRFTVFFLRIYIASYDKAYGPEYIPNGFENHLTVIFVPVNFKGYDSNRYYIIKPDDGEVIKISKSIKEGWIDSYITNKMPHLVTTIDKNYSGNQFGPNNEPSDTRSIFYSWNYFKEMVLTEIAYQKDPAINNIPVNGIELDFASAGNEGYKGEKGLRNRLLIQFEYARLNSSGQTEVFYIDDDKVHFPYRKSVSSEFDLPDRYPKGTGDTGNLCPKICN